MTVFPEGALVLSLPVPPSSNRYWRTRVVVPRPPKKPFVSTYVSPEAVEYREKANLMARVLRMPKVPWPTEVAFYAIWYRARRSGDLKNRNKVLEDALEGVAYENDSQIAESHWWRSDVDPKNARVEFCVVPIGS